VGSRDPLLEFWDPSNISGMVEAKKSNLARRWTAVNTNEKMHSQWQSNEDAVAMQARRLVPSATPDTVEQCRPGIDPKIDTKLPLKAKQSKAKKVLDKGAGRSLYSLLLT